MEMFELKQLFRDYLGNFNQKFRQRELLEGLQRPFDAS